MIRSMTGFARRERQGSWGTLACEIRSVNHRYLELSLRLPEDLRGLEGDARQAVSAALRRGKVDVGLYLRGQPPATAALEINRAVVEQVARTAAEVATIAGGSPASLNPLDLLRWPGVIREQERDLQPAQAAAMELLQETVRELNESRAREGARIREMLLGRCHVGAAVGGAAAGAPARRSPRASANGSASGSHSSAARSTRRGWSRNSCCSPTRWILTRNSTASAAT